MQWLASAVRFQLVSGLAPSGSGIGRGREQPDPKSIGRGPANAIYCRAGVVYVWSWSWVIERYCTHLPPLCLVYFFLLVHVCEFKSPLFPPLERGKTMDDPDKKKRVTSEIGERKLSS